MAQPTMTNKAKAGKASTAIPKSSKTEFVLIVYGDHWNGNFTAWNRYANLADALKEADRILSVDTYVGPTLINEVQIAVEVATLAKPKKNARKRKG